MREETVDLSDPVQVARAKALHARGSHRFTVLTDTEGVLARRKGHCRTCGIRLTPKNARRYEGRWVGRCQICESADSAARARATRNRARSATK